MYEAGPTGFDEARYVPVVLTRQGERLALRTLADDVRARCTPLFAVHPIDTDRETGRPVRSVEDHLLKLSRQLAEDWGTSAAFVDLKHVNPQTPLSDGSHPLEWFVARCAEWNLPLAPVISGTHGADYRAAAKRAADSINSTMGIRLTPAEWLDLGTPFGDGRLLALLAETGREPENVHLVIDIEDQVAATVAMTAAAVRPILKALPRALDWASLTVVASGMPTGTSVIGAGGEAEIPRLEWELWRLLDGSAGHRRPSFGDHCVQNPDPLSDFDPRFMDSSAQLRYTISSAWYTVRGRGIKRAGNEQIHDLAAKVVKHAEFSGPDFSWGDGWLAKCSSHGCTSGNQGVWRKVTTNHHITYVVRQLASLLGR